jgi:actin-related protein
MIKSKSGDTKGMGIDSKIIIDHGTYYTKYGYSGYNKPFDKMRSKLYKNKETNVVMTHDYVIKNKICLQELTEFVVIKNSIIVDFENIIHLWDTIFNNLSFNILLPNAVTNMTNVSVMITEPIFVSDTYHGSIKKIMLERYGIKKVIFCNQQLLGLYGTCSDKGIIVDVGYSNTRIVPIFESYILIEGVVLLTAGKECYNKYLISLNDNDDRKGFQEMLFNPDAFGVMDINLIDALIKCIKAVPIDLRKILCQNIVIIGGGSIGTMFTGALKKELESKLNISISVSAPVNRHILTWLGGSIVSVAGSLE